MFSPPIQLGHFRWAVLGTHPAVLLSVIPWAPACPPLVCRCTWTHPVCPPRFSGGAPSPYQSVLALMACLLRSELYVFVFSVSLGYLKPSVLLTLYIHGFHQLGSEQVQGNRFISLLNVGRFPSRQRRLATVCIEYRTDRLLRAAWGWLAGCGRMCGNAAFPTEWD